jgi:hypothetical protein
MAPVVATAHLATLDGTALLDLSNDIRRAVEFHQFISRTGTGVLSANGCSQDRANTEHFEFYAAISGIPHRPLKCHIL